MLNNDNILTQKFIYTLLKSGGLQSMGSLQVGLDWATSLSLFTLTQLLRKKYICHVFSYAIGKCDLFCFSNKYTRSKSCSFQDILPGKQYT